MAIQPPPPGTSVGPLAELRAVFGKSVRTKRLEAGWTQSELSKQSGIAQEEISRIENGQLNLTLQTMSRLAEVLNCDVSAMLALPPAGSGI